MTTPNAEDVDARSERLIEEFSAHKADVYAMLQREKPEYERSDSADRKIFEAWALQKIAGLQVVLEHNAEGIQEILIQEMNLAQNRNR